MKINVLNYTDEVHFSIKSIEQGHHKLTYKNIQIIKCPFDYVIMQMIMFEVKPDLVIEIGTHTGGSSLYIADLMDIIGKGIIHTIDINDLRFEECKSHNRIKFFPNGFEDYDLKNAENFETILVIDDGSHHYKDVLDSLNKFSSLVTKNSYFIVEDGIIDKLGWKDDYNGSPNRAIKEFISSNDCFIIDRKWCDLFGINATFNTNGFLKKII